MTHKVWVVQPASGLEKRQCTLQSCFSLGDKALVHPGIIFRGKWRVTEIEKLTYHPTVDVYWQECAWADTNVCVAWAKSILLKALKSLPKFVFFADNLEAQISLPFKQAISRMGGVLWYGPSGGTCLWQLVNAGYGKLFKALVGQKYHSWMDNADRWNASSGKMLSARERRVLLTHWVGRSWEKFHRQPDYQRCLALFRKDRLPNHGRRQQWWQNQPRNFGSLLCAWTICICGSSCKWGSLRRSRRSSSGAASAARPQWTRRRDYFGIWPSRRSVRSKRLYT